MSYRRFAFTVVLASTLAGCAERRELVCVESARGAAPAPVVPAAAPIAVAEAPTVAPAPLPPPIVSTPPVAAAPDPEGVMCPCPEPVCPKGRSSLAISLLLDRSGSMTGAPMEMAKLAAVETAKALTKQERIEVIAFDSSPARFVKMVCGTQERTLVQIGLIRPGGGTEIFSALDMGHTDLAAVDAQRKHLILLTDGRAPTAGIDDLVKRIATDGMTVSTIGLGGDVDEMLLRRIADGGGGRYFQIADPRSLPKVFVQELKLVRGGSAKAR